MLKWKRSGPGYLVTRKKNMYKLTKEEQMMEGYTVMMMLGDPNSEATEDCVTARCYGETIPEVMSCVVRALRGLGFSDYVVLKGLKETVAELEGN